MLNALTAARICSLALNTMCKELGLGNLAHHFDGEYADDWAILLPEVRALRNNRSVGSIELTDSITSTVPTYDLYINIPDVYDLVRSKHRSEFRPEDYGLHINTARDWLGTKMPDLEVEWSVGLDEIRQGPARPLARQQFQTGSITVKGSI